MEKGPEIRTVGGASVEKKEQAKKKIEQAFFNHFESLSLREQEYLKKYEYSKSEKEIAVIDFVNKETNKLMQDAGVDSYDIPMENYHIIPPNLYSKLCGLAAAAYPTRQGILFDAQKFRNNPVRFGATAFHETLHLKAHFAIRVEEKGDKIKRSMHQLGVSLWASQRQRRCEKKIEHFGNLHEAIVTEASKKFLPKLLKHPKFLKEREWLMSDEAKEMKKKLAKKKKIPEDDIIWVDKNGYRIFPYSSRRKILNYVCAEIQKQFPDQYQSGDDVFKVFLKAHFTGKLLPIARLVEKTFGKGSFRSFGTIGTTKIGTVLHYLGPLKSLKRFRAEQIKKTSSLK